MDKRTSRPVPEARSVLGVRLMEFAHRAKRRQAVRMSFYWRWLPVLLMLPVPAEAGSVASPVVDARVMEVGVVRHQDTLWRYARFSTESDYPCLRFEAIHPDQGWRELERLDVCDITLQDDATLDFRETAYTDFSVIEFSREHSAFTFEVEYIRRTAAGEQSVFCTLPVSHKENFGHLVCR